MGISEASGVDRVRMFGATDSHWFAALSGDLNPLHLETAYALRTPFGSPVVHGIAGVFIALGIWRGETETDRPPAAMQSMRVQFRKPVLWNQSLELTIVRPSDGTVVLEWRRGQTVYTKIEILLSDDPAEVPLTHRSAFFPRKMARLVAEPISWKAGHDFMAFTYAMDAAMFQAPRSPLRSDAVAFRQLQVLAWASYFVGMEWPGAAALFMDCSFEFAGLSHTASLDPFRLTALNDSFDSRFRVWSFTGESPDARFKLRCVERPEPVSYSSGVLDRHLPKTESFAARNWLIAGSTRGFGALLSLGLSRLGANVWCASRSASDGGRSPGQPVRCDISDASSCLQLSERFAEAGSELDGVILNASPSIVAIEWLESADEQTLSFISRVSAMVLYPLRALLPRVKEHGRIIYISSEYVKKPPRHFAHYIAAKSAAEGLMRALSVEFPAHQFIVVRPPRMLTDQTNLAFDRNPPESTEAVVGNLLTELSHRETAERPAGFSELDLNVCDPYLESPD